MFNNSTINWPCLAWEYCFVWTFISATECVWLNCAIAEYSSHVDLLTCICMHAQRKQKENIQKTGHHPGPRSYKPASLILRRVPVIQEKSSFKSAYMNISFFLLFFSELLLDKPLLIFPWFAVFINDSILSSNKIITCIFYTPHILCTTWAWRKFLLFLALYILIVSTVRKHLVPLTIWFPHSTKQ